MKQDVYDQSAGATTRRPGTEARGGAPQSDAEKQEMMKKMEAAGTPGPNHKALEHYVGNWRCEVKCWMDPNGQPQQSQATAKTTWIMGGRFLQEDFQGSMMGRPFNGRMILGYNNIKQTYQGVWFDDMSTALFTIEGKGDNKTITLEGRGTCPARGRADIPMKAVYRVTAPDKHTFEMYDDGKRTMEITYTRQ